MNYGSLESMKKPNGDFGFPQENLNRVKLLFLKDIVRTFSAIFFTLQQVEAIFRLFRAHTLRITPAPPQEKPSNNRNRPLLGLKITRIRRDGLESLKIDQDVMSLAINRTCYARTHGRAKLGRTSRASASCCRWRRSLLTRRIFSYKAAGQAPVVSIV